MVLSITEIENRVKERYPGKYPDHFEIVDIIDDLLTYFPNLTREGIFELLCSGNGVPKSHVSFRDDGDIKEGHSRSGVRDRSRAKNIFNNTLGIKRRTP